MAGADAVTTEPAPGTVKAVRAVNPAKPVPRATEGFWLGLVPGSPLSYWPVPGATFHRETGQYSPTGDPEHPFRMNHSAGGVVRLLPEQVKAIAVYVGAHVCRWRGEPGDTKTGFALVKVSDPEYDGGRPTDVPMGRYCYMMKGDTPGMLGGKLPEVMA